MNREQVQSKAQGGCQKVDEPRWFFFLYSQDEKSSTVFSWDQKVLILYSM